MQLGQQCIGQNDRLFFCLHHFYFYLLLFFGQSDTKALYVEKNPPACEEYYLSPHSPPSKSLDKRNQLHFFSNVWPKRQSWKKATHTERLMETSCIMTHDVDKRAQQHTNPLYAAVFNWWHEHHLQIFKLSDFLLTSKRSVKQKWDCFALENICIFK